MRASAALTLLVVTALLPAPAAAAAGEGAPACPRRGACMAYDEYEAEEARTNGEVLPENRSIGSFASESSGRRSVRLRARGDFVEVVAARAANSVVVRYAVPDTPGGAAATLSLSVDGVPRPPLQLTSRYAWSYGWAIPYAENSSGGVAHHFFDEARAGPAAVGDIPAGAAVRVEVGAADAAAYYVVDLIDLEMVADPLPQPAGSVSIARFGARAADGADDRAAVQAAIDAAAREGTSVWIPAGAFDVGAEGELAVPPGVAVAGAGMWHSTLRGNTRFVCTGGNCSYADFAVLGAATNRVTGRAHGFAGGAGRGTRLVNVWVEHTVCGYWVGNGDTDELTITGCRFRNLYADGVNLCNGASNSVVEHSHFRNTGDDAVASWAPEKDGGNNTNNTMRWNTVQLPWRANCYAVYGGRDQSIEDSVCADVVSYPGVLVAASFGAWPFAGTTAVRRTTLTRAGGPMWGNTYGSLMVHAKERGMARVEVADVAIDASSYSGVHIAGPFSAPDVRLDNVSITGAATWGIQVDAGAQGMLTLRAVTITSSGSGSVDNEAGAGFRVVNETR